MNAQDIAEITALKALAWLIGHEELRPVFLGSSGMDEAGLRAAASHPDTLAAVLDFIVMDDAWVLEFAAAQNLPPDAVMQARAALPGGGEVHWT